MVGIVVHHAALIGLVSAADMELLQLLGLEDGKAILLRLPLQPFLPLTRGPQDAPLGILLPLSSNLFGGSCDEVKAPEL